MSEIALSLDLCDRLPCPCGHMGVPGGSNAPVWQLLRVSFLFLLSHHLQPLCDSAPCCTAVVAQKSSSLLPTLLLQLPTSALATGLCKPKEKLPPMAKAMQLRRRNLAGVLPSPLACFALSGGHHMVFHILPTKTFVSVLAERRRAITGESVSMGVSEKSQ